MLRTGAAASNGIGASAIARRWRASRQTSMTDYDTKRLRCYCCSKASEQTVLMSTNSFGSPGLDQRAAGMARHTIRSWLQECPGCGYVAPDIGKGDERALSFAGTGELRAASSH